MRNTILGYLDIPWGASQEDVQREYPGTSDFPKYIREISLLYSQYGDNLNKMKEDVPIVCLSDDSHQNPAIAGRKFYFYENQLYRVDVNFEAGRELTEALQIILEDKYGGEFKRDQYRNFCLQVSYNLALIVGGDGEHDFLTYENPQMVETIRRDMALQVLGDIPL